MGLDKLPPELEAAFKMFLGEFEGHLAHFHKVIERASQPETLTDETRVKDQRSIEHRFHLLKGSAGFFKLQGLREVAAHGEKAFRSPQTVPDYCALVQTELQKLVADLEREFSSIRA